MKRLLISFALFATFALLLSACGGAEQSSNGNSNTAGTQNSNKSSTTTNPETSTPASKSADSAGDKIGIAECDDYLAKYEACVTGKVPESARAQYKSSLEDLRKSWREMAANPKTKAGLAMACQVAAEQGKQQFKMYGCEF